jgi:hypothetical protein
MTLVAAFSLVALVLAGVDLGKSKGQSLTAWAVVFLALAHLLTWRF